MEAERPRLGIRKYEVSRSRAAYQGQGTSVFLGEYQHTLDAKGRVSLPRKHRDEIGSRVVVSKGLEKCLYVYPAEGYQDFLRNLLDSGDFDRNARQVRRFFTSGATEVDIDTAGRVAVASALREFAGLGRDVVVAGVGDHIEIWDAAAWAAYEDESAPTIEDAAEALARSGLL